jgi:hypothetical protein
LIFWAPSGVNSKRARNGVMNLVCMVSLSFFP